MAISPGPGPTGIGGPGVFVAVSIAVTVPPRPFDTYTVGAGPDTLPPRWEPHRLPVVRAARAARSRAARPGNAGRPEPCSLQARRAPPGHRPRRTYAGYVPGRARGHRSWVQVTPRFRLIRTSPGIASVRPGGWHTRSRAVPSPGVASELV